MPSYLSGVKDFIKSWDDPFVGVAGETGSDVIRESPQGNINSEGTSACYNSPAFTKYHRKFKKSLEAGIRDLTLALILKLNCITYSSCQGHRATDDAVMRQRYVGILPRDHTEYEYLYGCFQNLAALTNSLCNDTSVRVYIQEDTLQSEDCVMPCLNLFFVGIRGDEDSYFQDLEIVYQKFISLVNMIHY
ncbi:MAG: hypothetical protein N3E45_04180 [Oscillatoriaceae bacterium SKW80]|nr:hypothetical protein [Oscillatoriaceae bacterium SKYG93]MCX8120017.1 hypothetical protein [Oscillatoriaceae bacterium SKW80]MDW8454010.1 hypothetical protein [Oscillatoriaceae cyanobacterium SKYGB_i_bin93]HIK29671.1 hypothetical protein [Oscillatoriaceae cyanobacterium M7585_C2015_266]